MQVALQWGPEAEPTWPGCELPQLALPSGQLPHLQLTGEGLARFGDVSVVRGSGKVAPDPAGDSAAAAAVTLHIAVQLRQVQLAGAEQHALAEGGWLTVWEKEIVFSDDGQFAERVALMSQVQRKHVANVQVRVPAGSSAQTMFCAHEHRSAMSVLRTRQVPRPSASILRAACMSMWPAICSSIPMWL